MDVDFDCIERGLRFLSEGKPHGQVDLMAGLCIIKEGDLFWLATGKDASTHSDYPSGQVWGSIILSTIPSTLYLDNGWELHAEGSLTRIRQFNRAIPTWILTRPGWMR